MRTRRSATGDQQRRGLHCCTVAAKIAASGFVCVASKEREGVLIPSCCYRVARLGPTAVESRPSVSKQEHRFRMETWSNESGAKVFRRGSRQATLETINLRTTGVEQRLDDYRRIKVSASERASFTAESPAKSGGRPTGATPKQNNRTTSRRRTLAASSMTR